MTEFNYTRKLFYKKYAYRVMIKNTLKLYGNENAKRFIYDYNPKYFSDKDQKFLKNLKKWIDKDTRSIFSYSISFFLKDESAFLEMCDDFSDILVEVTQPENLKVVEALRNDVDLRIVKTLPKRGFRYKVKINPFDMKFDEFYHMYEAISQDAEYHLDHDWYKNVSKEELEAYFRYHMMNLYVSTEEKLNYLYLLCPGSSIATTLIFATSKELS